MAVVIFSLPLLRSCIILLDQVAQYSGLLRRAEHIFIMSDNGVAAEDERSQIKDEGGDDEVRDGVFMFIYNSPRPVHCAPREAGGFARL